MYFGMKQFAVSAILSLNIIMKAYTTSLVAAVACFVFVFDVVVVAAAAAATVVVVVVGWLVGWLVASSSVLLLPFNSDLHINEND